MSISTIFLIILFLLYVAQVIIFILLQKKEDEEIDKLKKFYSMYFDKYFNREEG